MLFIPNQKAIYEKIHSDKYYNRLKENGFVKKENIYIFDESKSEKFRDLNIDIIYISGGNTFATLDKIRKANFENYIKEYIKKGVIYIGGSCGAHIVTKNIEHLLKLDDNYIDIIDFNALGVFDGVVIPHCEAKDIHYEVGKKARCAIADIGGMMPEEMPIPKKSLKELEREKKKLENKQQKKLEEINKWNFLYNEIK